MASIRREVLIDVPAEDLWAAVRDVGALHTRLVTGFVIDCRLEGNARIVTFANGIVWSASGGRLSHHNASSQVFAEGAARCRLVWIADLLPDEMAPAITGMIEQGLAAMKQTLERAAKTG